MRHFINALGRFVTCEPQPGDFVCVGGIDEGIDTDFPCPIVKQGTRIFYIGEIFWMEEAR